MVFLFIHAPILTWGSLEAGVVLAHVKIHIALEGWTTKVTRDSNRICKNASHLPRQTALHMLYFARFIKVNMTSLEYRHPLARLAEGLKLDYPEMGILVDSVSQKASPYEFFRLLATQIVPYLRKQKYFSTLVNRWERQCRDHRRKQETLKNLAVEEVGVAIGRLAERLENSTELKTPDVLKALGEAKGYLNGTIPTYMPSHYECAADSLASACRILLRLNGHTLLDGIAKSTMIRESQQVDGVWKPIEVPCLEKCYFYEAITKLTKEGAKWSWDSFDHSFVCWSYLRLAERCWNLTEEDFEGESLTHQTVEEGQRSAELLGLHGYWTELQSIKSRRSSEASFFTIERFGKYLEIIATQILTQPKKSKPSEVSLGLASIALALDGEHLLLLTESGNSKGKTRYLLHKFNGASDPRSFINQLIANPGKEVTPADIGMKSNSCSNLLNRTKLTGSLKALFFKKGARKGSIQLITPRIELKNHQVAARLNLEEQLDELKLSLYKD